MSQIISSQGFEYGVKHFINSEMGELKEIISRTLEISATEVEALLNLGAVYINNLRQNQNSVINANQSLRVHTKPRRFHCAYDWQSLIVFESEDYVVLNKPSGVPSHPTVDNLIDNSLHQVSLHLKKPLHITHRLDTMTEGLIVYAKNNLFVKSFNRQLQDHQIEKKYCALIDTEKILPPRLIHYMEPSPRAPKKVSTSTQDNWLFCELEILQQKKTLDTTWVKINLLTGRTHQIRAQLSEFGAPILGDQLYGSNRVWKEKAIALRACEIQFNWNAQLLTYSLDDQF